MSDWVQQLQEGNKLDVKSSKDTGSVWKIGTVTNENIHAFRIHYDYHDVWIAKSSERLAPLYTHTVHVIHMSKPAVISNETNAPPLYYTSYTGNNDYIIITMNNSDVHTVYGNAGHILIYDNINDSYNTIQYPKNSAFKSHCSCINKQTGDIYIYCNAEKLFMIYNIERNEWNITTLSSLTELFQTKMIYIASPYEQIHLFGITNERKAHHFVYHLKRKHLIVLNSFNDKFNEHLTNFDLINVVFQNRLMLLGGIDTDTFGLNATSDVIWTFDICEEYDFHSNIWQLYGMLPHKSISFTSTVAFNHTIFVFYFKSTEGKEIWCLDLLHDTWIKCEKMYPLKYEESATKTCSNYVHFIYCGYMAFHVKISLIDLIPASLVAIYTKYYTNVVSVYSRYVMRNVSNVIFPDDIKQIITCYVPLWL